MARGKFKDKQITFNKAQFAMISNYSTKGLIELTGIPEGQCYDIRTNKPRDYRLSTIKRLAEGLGMTMSEFINLQ